MELKMLLNLWIRKYPYSFKDFEDLQVVFTRHSVVNINFHVRHIIIFMFLKVAISKL